MRMHWIIRRMTLRLTEHFAIDYINSSTWIPCNFRSKQNREESLCRDLFAISQLQCTCAKINHNFLKLNSGTIEKFAEQYQSSKYSNLCWHTHTQSCNLNLLPNVSNLAKSVHHKQSSFYCRIFHALCSSMKTK